MISIYESCKHRPQAAQDAAALTQTILSATLPAATDGIVHREKLIATTLSILRRFDDAAATIYDAYHRQSGHAKQ
jgi:hypothetical protein